MVVFVRRSLIRGRSRSGGPPRSACFAVVARRAAPIVLVLLVSLVAALALAALALVLVVLARASPMAARAVASRVAARAARVLWAQLVSHHRRCRDTDCASASALRWWSSALRSSSPALWIATPPALWWPAPRSSPRSSPARWRFAAPPRSSSVFLGPFSSGRSETRVSVVWCLSTFSFTRPAELSTYQTEQEAPIQLPRRSAAFRG